MSAAGDVRILVEGVERCDRAIRRGHAILRVLSASDDLNAALRAAREMGLNIQIAGGPAVVPVVAAATD